MLPYRSGDRALRWPPAARVSLPGGGSANLSMTEAYECAKKHFYDAGMKASPLQRNR